MLYFCVIDLLIYQVRPLLVIFILLVNQRILQFGVPGTKKAIVRLHVEAENCELQECAVTVTTASALIKEHFHATQFNVQVPKYVRLNK